MNCKRGAGEVEMMGGAGVYVWWQGKREDGAGPIGGTAGFCCFQFFFASTHPPEPKAYPSVVLVAPPPRPVFVRVMRPSRLLLAWLTMLWIYMMMMKKKKRRGIIFNFHHHHHNTMIIVLR